MSKPLCSFPLVDDDSGAKRQQSALVHPVEQRGYFVPNYPAPDDEVRLIGHFHPISENAEGSKLPDYFGDDEGKQQWRWRFHAWLERVFEWLP